MSPTDNPYRPPVVRTVPQRGDRALWIEHRLREGYVGFLAAVVGWQLSRQLPPTGLFRVSRPVEELLLLLVMTVVPAIVAVVALRSWRSNRSVVEHDI